MEAGQRVRLQSFTRVHLVPRVNGSPAAALIFERQDEEPLAIALPLAVLGQLFGVMPRVIAQSSAEGDQSGPPLDVAMQGSVAGLEPVAEAAASLLVQIEGVRMQLQVAPELLARLASQMSRKGKPSSARLTAADSVAPKASKTRALAAADAKPSAPKKTRAAPAKKAATSRSKAG